MPPLRRCVVVLSEWCFQEQGRVKNGDGRVKNGVVRSIVSIEAVLIAYPEEVEQQVKTHVGEEGKLLANVLMCDDEMVLSATLWGEVATQAIACIKSLMGACAEEEFPRVRLSAVEVVGYRHTTTPVLKKVQSTMATTVSFISRVRFASSLAWTL